MSMSVDRETNNDNTENIIINVDDLRAEAKRLLDIRKNIKDNESERKRLFNEYSKIMMKIKYYTDEEFKENKKKQSKEHHQLYKDNEFYKNKRNNYSLDYYYNVKREKPLKHLNALCVF